MHFTSLILSTLAIVPLGAFAWAKAGNGVWIANNKVYERVGNCKSHISVSNPPPSH